MTKKQLILLAAVVLVGIYLVFFTDWFASSGIRITHAFRPPSAVKRPRPGAVFLGRPVSPIVFMLNRKCRLTEIKVVNASEVSTNKYAHPVWHMVSNKELSPPTRGFLYGGFVRGMRPKVPNAEADPLEPNVTYRLIVLGENFKLEHDFKGPILRLARR